MRMCSTPASTNFHISGPIVSTVEKVERRIGRVEHRLAASRAPVSETRCLPSKPARQQLSGRRKSGRGHRRNRTAASPARCRRWTGPRPHNRRGWNMHVPPASCRATRRWMSLPISVSSTPGCETSTPARSSIVARKMRSRSVARKPTSISDRSHTLSPGAILDGRNIGRMGEGRRGECPAEPRRRSASVSTTSSFRRTPAKPRERFQPKWTTGSALETRQNKSRESLFRVSM